MPLRNTEGLMLDTGAANTNSQPLKDLASHKPLQNQRRH